MDADFWTKLFLFGAGFTIGLVLALGYVVKFLADINVLKRKLDRVTTERDGRELLSNKLPKLLASTTTAKHLLLKR